MPLSAGTRLGPYEIVAKIGEGGMGLVYRAHDSKLNRDVALKILPDSFANDPERLARFTREAQTLAALNHANIAHIHGLEEADGIRAIVMEFVDGEDLSQMIAGGEHGLPEAESVGSRPRDANARPARESLQPGSPGVGPRRLTGSRAPRGLDIDDALLIARQIAAALEAAHDAGIVHRDLKPANIKVRPDGTVKVLDFGLAKASDPSGAVSGSLANSPTLTAPATRIGMILGTAAYMSPEQARGKPVDRRADVWAFGVVLYEMLTGTRAFQGAEVSDVLASVLKDTPPMDRLPPDTPAPIRRLLRRCLQKDRAERLDSMATARLEIADALAPGAGDAVAAAPLPGAPPRGRMRLIGAAVGVALAALGFLLGSRWRAPAAPADARLVAFDVTMPGPPLVGVAITPAGDRLVFQTDWLFTRGLADADLKEVAGTTGARNLFMSPDGRWVGFYADSKIKKVALAGGDPLNVADVDLDSPGAGWGPGNTVIYSPGWNSAMFSVSADGGDKPVAVSTVDRGAGELGHWWPQTLPDQKHVLFTVWTAGTGINDSRIAVLDLSTKTHRVLMPGAYARYTPTGHLVYFHAGGYHAVRFELGAMKPAGDPVRVLPGVQAQSPNGSRNKAWAVSNDGTLVALSNPQAPIVELAWATPSGNVTRINLPPRALNTTALADDGRRLVTDTTEGGSYVLSLVDLARESEQRLALPGSNWGPEWDSHGTDFLFGSLRLGTFDIQRYSLDDGKTTLLVDDPLDQSLAGVTNDGSRFLFLDYLANGSTRLLMAPVASPKDRTDLGVSENVQNSTFSPDDRWVALQIAAGGRPSELIVRPFPSGASRVNISPRGGTQLIWPKTGSKLFYQRRDELLGVTYATTGGRFTVDREEVLFSVPGLLLLGLAPDGRFLIARPVSDQTPRARVVLNWVRELP